METRGENKIPVQSPFFSSYSSPGHAVKEVLTVALFICHSVVN